MYPMYDMHTVHLYCIILYAIIYMYYIYIMSYCIIYDTITIDLIHHI